LLDPRNTPKPHQRSITGTPSPAKPSGAVWWTPAKRFPHADQVKVSSGRTVTVFNLTNAYRLVTAIHYNPQCVYILHVLTHAEYDRNGWKATL
jgi:mRNA-degrading endonuclease HigB of HigAB toxin-antitoxin module